MLDDQYLMGSESFMDVLYTLVNRIHLWFLPDKTQVNVDILMSLCLCYYINIVILILIYRDTLDNSLLFNPPTFPCTHSDPC